MKRKIIPTLVAVLLIIIIAAAAFGEDFMEGIKYSSEKMDLDEYFDVVGDQLAIVLQNEILEEKALLRDGRCYFTLDTVSKYFDDTFYFDEEEKQLLYSTPSVVYSVELGGDAVSFLLGGEGVQAGPFADGGKGCVVHCCGLSGVFLRLQRGIIRPACTG